MGIIAFAAHRVFLVCRTIIVSVYRTTSSIERTLSASRCSVEGGKLPLSTWRATRDVRDCHVPPSMNGTGASIAGRNRHARLPVRGNGP